MKNLYIISVLIFIGSCLTGQENKWGLKAIETNVLSWAGGHIGPEVRAHFSSDYNKSSFFIGYRYAFTTLGLSDSDPTDLTQYSQSLSAGHDIAIGYRKLTRVKGLYFNILLQYGIFNYDNNQSVCTRAVPTTNDLVAYCRCIEVTENSFTEKAGRFGGFLEGNYRIFSRSNVQFGVSFMAGGNFVANKFDTFQEHATCQISQRSELQTPQWFNHSTLWLQGIPKNENQLLEDDIRITIGIRFGLWVTYTIN